MGTTENRVKLDEEGAGAVGFPEDAWFLGPVLLAERASEDAQVFLRELGSSDAIASIMANSRTQPPLYLLRKE